MRVCIRAIQGLDLLDRLEAIHVPTLNHRGRVEDPCIARSPRLSGGEHDPDPGFRVGDSEIGGPPLERGAARGLQPGRHGLLERFGTAS